MNLYEQIQRSKKLMGIKESKTIYNLDIIETSVSKATENRKWYDQQIEKIKSEFPSDFDAQWQALQAVQDELKRKEQDDKNYIEPNEQTHEPVNQIAWRAGDLKLNPNAGGIWFGENKEDVEKFAWSVRHEKREGKPYHITIKNPYYFNSFWNGYIEKVEEYIRSTYQTDGRFKIMEKLKELGHDGFVIGEDTWNDTGDDNQVNSKQFVIFNEEQAKPADGQ